MGWGVGRGWGKAVGVVGWWGCQHMPGILYRSSRVRSVFFAVVTKVKHRGLRWYKYQICKCQFVINDISIPFRAYLFQQTWAIVTTLTPHSPRYVPHWFRFCLVDYSAPTHYMKQCIVNWTLRNKLRWNLIWKTKPFIHGNAVENFGYRDYSILSSGPFY